MISKPLDPRNPGRKTGFSLVATYSMSTLVEDMARKVFTLNHPLINRIHADKDLPHVWGLSILFPTRPFSQRCEASRAANTSFPDAPAALGT